MTQPHSDQTIGDLLGRLRRIASPDEITGDGVTEEMVGPAANEMRWRMKEAGRIADDLEAALTAYVESIIGEDEPEPGTAEGVHPRTQRDFFIHGRNSLRIDQRRKLKEQQ